MLIIWLAAAAAQAVAAPNNPLNIPMPTAEELRRCNPPGITESTPMSAVSRSQLDAALTCVQALMAGKINLIVPATVDPLTTLTSAQGEGTILRYNYRVDINGAAVTAGQRQAIADATRAYVCAQPDMVQTIAYGGAYRYVWNDRAERPLHQVLIDRCR